MHRRNTSNMAVESAILTYLEKNVTSEERSGHSRKRRRAEERAIITEEIITTDNNIIYLPKVSY